MKANEIYLGEMAVIYEQAGPSALDAAITACIREGKFMPTICELRERAGLNQTKAAESEAQQAWLMVLAYMRRYGTERRPVCRGRDAKGELIMEYPPDLPERIKHAVRIAGGLNAISETAPDVLNFRRDDFVGAYQSYEYVERFPLALPEGLRDLLPAARMPKALPSRREVAAALEGVAEATTDEALARVRRKVEAAKVPDEGPAPKQYSRLRGPLTDAEIEEKKLAAKELEKKFTQGAGSTKTD